mmetsp:Transcript_4544/g.18232  ORF Transcript_4544/g.18232 Transcript_4544/m.18232 type:complete len:228 (+) Transcript_4544:430-1113(+)
MFSTAAMPSSSALCASMGPSIMSPMAYTPGTLVWNLPSTCTRPRASSCTPASSRPSPSVYGVRPTDTSTTSTSIVSVSPPLEGSMLRRTLPSAFFSAPVIFVESLNFMPCLVSERWKALRISPSMVGTMLGRNSTTVTSEPRRLHTEPISRPMYPPPMTTSLLGTSCSSSAPVDDTICSSSMGTPGRLATAEPVARMTFLAFRVSSPPSLSATDTALPALSLPQPFT